MYNSTYTCFFFGYVHTGTQNLYAAQLYQNEGGYRFNNTAAVTVTLHHPVYTLVSPVSSEQHCY